MEATKGNGLTRRAFPRRGKGRGREGRMRSRRQQRGRGPLGTIGSPVNQGINMLDTSPPRGNAFVTPGNIFLPLASSPRPLSLFLLCSLYPSPRAPPPLHTERSSHLSVLLRRFRSALFYHTRMAVAQRSQCAGEFS